MTSGRVRVQTAVPSHSALRSQPPICLALTEILQCLTGLVDLWFDMNVTLPDLPFSAAGVFT